MTIQVRMMEWTDEKVRKFWDYESQFPENYFAFQVGRSVVHVLSQYFDGKKNVLDYGCGAGFLVKHLLRKNIDVAALDFSPRSVVLVNDKYRAESKFKGAYTFEEIVTANIKFDIITVVEVIEHLNNSYLAKTIDNLKFLLTEGGTVIFTTPNDEDLSKSMIYCPESDNIFHRWQHVRSWSTDSLRDFLVRNGFEIVEIFAINFSTIERELDDWIFKMKNRLKIKLGKSNKLPHLVAVVKLPPVEQPCAE